MVRGFLCVLVRIPSRSIVCWLIRVTEHPVSSSAFTGCWLSFQRSIMEIIGRSFFFLFFPGAPRWDWCVSVFLTLSYPSGSCRMSHLAVAEVSDNRPNQTDTSESPGKLPGPSRIIHRNTTSELSGSMLGLSRSKQSAKAPQGSCVILIRFYEASSLIIALRQ